MQVVAAIAVVGLIALAGCGGADESGSEADDEAALSKSDYIERADAICRQHRRDTAELERRYDDLPSELSAEKADEAASIVREIADAGRETARELRQLSPPSGDAEVLGDWIASGEAGVSLLESLAGAIEQLDEDRIRVLSRELESKAAEGNGLARGYGFEVCGQEED